jgi:copper(I)-binding protein
MSHSRLAAAFIATTIGGFPILASARAAAPAINHTASPSEAVLVADRGIAVPEAWARASAGAATTGAAYVTLVGGAQTDQLVGASTPIAVTAEVHETISDGGIMRMRPVAAVPIPPGKTVTFAPGGYHIMLIDLQHPLTAGERFPLTLKFAHATPVTVQVTVRGLGGPTDPHNKMKMP